ncbi:MAG: collagenase-like protease, partial [Campylobacter sp.]|nr:collagenase-like protease [Campylobacter sp.]
MKKPELLSPAGNLTKLQIVLAYGADAVYASVGNFSLRQRSAKEFDLESFEEGVRLAHKSGAKFYA